MSKIAKLIDSMRANPAGDWSIGDVQRVCDAMGWTFMQPASGSHCKVAIPGHHVILTVPARRPIKPVYIRKLIALIDEVGDHGSRH